MGVLAQADVSRSLQNVLAQADFGRSLQNVLDQIARIVPRLVVFALIILIGWVVAKALERAAALVLRKLRFDRFAERGPVAAAMRRSTYDASGLLARLLYYAVLLVTLELAFNVFGPNPVSTVLRSIVAWLPRLAAAVLIIIVASAIAHAVRELITAAIGGLSYGRFLAAAASIFIIGLGVIAAVNQIQIATTVTEPVLITVLATIGAVVAIGVGGGMIRPMQERWERVLTRAERDASAGRGGAYARGFEDARRGAGTPAEAPAGASPQTPSRPPGDRPPSDADRLP